jgi:hypothetical protein
MFGGYQDHKPNTSRREGIPVNVETARMELEHVIISPGS